MAKVIKVATDEEGGIAQDAVEALLQKTEAGEELAVYGDDGHVIYVHTNIDFEEV